MHILITFASVTDCLKNKRFIHECLFYTENNFSRTSNSLNCVNFTITLSVTFCIIQGDQHRPSQIDPTRPDPTRPVDGPDPCPTLVRLCCWWWWTGLVSRRPWRRPQRPRRTSDSHDAISTEAANVRRARSATYQRRRRPSAFTQSPTLRVTVFSTTSPGMQNQYT